jgi:hypothetical protein
VPWTIPRYTATQVNVAGGVLVDPLAEPEATDHALTVINNWRASHSFPLNTFAVWLRLKARPYRSSIVAQRIKRLSSIAAKLERFQWLQLSEMQDIGGCRAIVASVAQVYELVTAYQSSSIKHTLVDSDDYIRNPKRSGYRGYHLIYKYHSDRNLTYEGLKIEIQLRSRRQHAWATAVETVGAFTKQALKSSLGRPEWLRFFALMGTVIANGERSPIVPGTPADERLLSKELLHLAAELEVEKRLETYGGTLRLLEGPANAHYFLLTLDSNKRRVRIQRFMLADLEQAQQEYATVEANIRDQPGMDAVLVSVQSLNALRRGYPNYFLDTSVFLGEVRGALTSARRTNGD